MWNGANSTEDSDETTIMERQETETESEEQYAAQKYSDVVRRKQAESYHDLEHKCCSKCNQPCYEVESPELGGRRRARRSKDQLQHCPSCHCPPEAIKYSIGRTNYPKTMEAVLNEYEDFLIDPTSRSFKKSQSYQLSPRLCRVTQCGHPAYGHHHSRKRQTSSHRRQCRNEQDPSLAIMKSMLHSSANDTNYEYPRSVRNSYKKDGWRNDQILSGIAGTADADKYTQHKREQMTKPRQHVDVVNKLNASERYQLGDYEDDDCFYARSRLRFDFKENKKKQTRQKAENSPNRHSILKSCSAQSATKTKNEDSYKVSTIDLCEYSKDEESLPKETESRSMKPSQRTSRQTEDTACRPDKEPTSNKEEVRDDSYSDLAVKDEEQEATYRKNIYAGGDLDLDLHTAKSFIVGLIDKVVNKKLSPPLDQQKNADSNRGLTTEQGIYIEIRRALQSDLCEPSADDLLSQSKLNVDCIKHLKDLRWQHMNHIQNELRELVKIQKFLDTYSPRQSMAAFQSHSGAVEQRIEDKQQQQHQNEEKQNLGTIS